MPAKRFGMYKFDCLTLGPRTSDKVYTISGEQLQLSKVAHGHPPPPPPPPALNPATTSTERSTIVNASDEASDEEVRASDTGLKQFEGSEVGLTDGDIGLEPDNRWHSSSNVYMLFYQREDVFRSDFASEAVPIPVHLRELVESSNLLHAKEKSEELEAKRREIALKREQALRSTSILRSLVVDPSSAVATGPTIPIDSIYSISGPSTLSQLLLVPTAWLTEWLHRPELPPSQLLGSTSEAPYSTSDSSSCSLTSDFTGAHTTVSSGSRKQPDRIAPRRTDPDLRISPPSLQPITRLRILPCNSAGSQLVCPHGCISINLAAAAVRAVSASGIVSTAFEALCIARDEKSCAETVTNLVEKADSSEASLPEK
ncbi:unnamed protein product [Protopolystoma xenopodis]|uniref:USP domain-containing protein n=1 Tax=Protopolystoma xenopodis TaxID=117903 RepID=A0A3S5CNL3_9PLAT|nr:unnamed protein product [Protopolystoma xenopodis]